MKNLYFLLILVFSVNSIVFSQCAAPEKIIKGGGKDKFVLNKQSKSGALNPGDSYELVLNAQEGFDYKVMAEIDERNADPIAFEVYENVSDKDENGEFKKVKKTIKSSDGLEPVLFRVSKTSVLYIKVNLPPNENMETKCVGVLIEDRKSTKIGF